MPPARARRRVVAAAGLALAALAGPLGGVRGAHARTAAAAEPIVAIDGARLVHDGRLYIAVDALGADVALGAPGGGPTAASAPRRRGLMSDAEAAERLPTFTFMWWLYLGCALSCVVSAAFAAGLTMGLVSLDPMQLQIILHMDPQDCESAEECKQLLIDQACAERVYPIVENHHLLLVTLLLVNAGANETLPIFLDSLVPSWAAIVISVTFVLIFGEIIPSAIFTGPNQLRIAAALSPVVYSLIVITAPLSYPISLLLDRMLGESNSSNAFKRQELRAIMKMQHERLNPQDAGDSFARRSATLPAAEGGAAIALAAGAGSSAAAADPLRSALTTDELAIINGVLDIRNKVAADTMISLAETFMLSTEDVLDSETMATILSKGHSRIPVYRGWPHNVCGLILVKKLIVLSPEDKRRISSLGLRYPLPVSPDTPLLELLNEFQCGMSHMAIVTNQPELVAECMRNGRDIPPHVHMDGIVTLEDILEQIIAEGIADETDEGVSKVLAEAARTRSRVAAVKHLAEQFRVHHKRPTIANMIADSFSARARKRGMSTPPEAKPSPAKAAAAPDVERTLPSQPQSIARQDSARSAIIMEGRKSRADRHGSLGPRANSVSAALDEVEGYRRRRTFEAVGTTAAERGLARADGSARPVPIAAGSGNGRGDADSLSEPLLDSDTGPRTG